MFISDRIIVKVAGNEDRHKSSGKFDCRPWYIYKDLNKLQQRIPVQDHYWCKYFRKKYEIAMGWVRFKPTPATAAAPSHSESGDITTAPLRFLETSFTEQYYAWFLWMTRRIEYIFGALYFFFVSNEQLLPSLATCLFCHHKNMPI